MSVAAAPIPSLRHDFADALPELCVPWEGAPVARPALLVANAPLAAELGLDLAALRSDAGVAVLCGSTTPPGARPVAMAYAGHQFGGYSPRLGDGRALLLGELVDRHGARRDLHLKGSGKTPFARAGDGLAAVGPMLRELAMGEAMHALGIPTTRALSVVATNEAVRRETLLPGAVLARVASSHLRVGTFEYAARLPDPGILRRLADYAIARHDPDAADADDPYLELLRGVVGRQAELVAAWVLAGFVHGVMNTDNMAISGETIDYGPCAFLDRYDLGAAFSSIDAQGRYAYGNQPTMASWNLARLGEALLPLLGGRDDDARGERANATLAAFGPAFRDALTRGMAAKLGIPTTTPDAEVLIEDLLAIEQAEGVDHTRFFRSLAGELRRDAADAADRGVGAPVADASRRAGATNVAAAAAGELDRSEDPRVEVDDVPRLENWITRWRDLLREQGRPPGAAADAMDSVNPVYIPRNHLVEAALSAATAGDLAPFAEMLEVLAAPFTPRPDREAWSRPAPDDAPSHVTFCGT